MINKKIGITLLEVMLVLAIASSIILMGIGQYKRYSIQQNFSAVKANVDQLFQSLGYFYQTNCDDNANNILNSLTPGIIPAGQLAPTHSANPVKVPIANLVPANWPTPNPVVDATAVTDFTSGYTAQFNPKTSTAIRQAYNCTFFNNLVCTTPIAITNSSVLIWTGQVAVKIVNATLAHLYQAYVQADCLVDSVTPGTAIDCTDSSLTSASSRFLVWQRLPSFASPDINSQSSLWATKPTAKEFKLLYTHDPMYELYAQPSPNNYLCGG